MNVALALARPLLIRGEPGTGKTLLAQEVAAALGMELVRWHVKSTTRAQDGRYVHDTVARLHDSRFGGGDVRDIAHYLRLGPMGRALASPTRVVLLIDEVDKADLEFPNDLLHELDAMRFQIAETGEEIAARERPFVVITSNNEKELPADRCSRASPGDSKPCPTGSGTGACGKIPTGRRSGGVARGRDERRRLCRCQHEWSSGPGRCG